MSSFPKVIAKKSVFTCPWLSLVESQVRLKDSKTEDESYYSIQQPDYVAIVALTPSGLFPLIRQYRPAVESFTLELPAGIVDKGEKPEATAVRELKEETGLIAEKVISLGAFYPDTGRLSNLQHVYLVLTNEKTAHLEIEPGLEVLFKNREEIHSIIRSGDFKHQLHVGAFLLAMNYLQTSTGKGT